MTHAEAASLREGDTVIAKHSTPPYRPLRVTDVKVAGVTGTRYVVRISALVKGPDAWIDPSAIQHPPAGALWDARANEWRVAVDSLDEKGKPCKRPGHERAAPPRFATFDDLDETPAPAAAEE